LTVLVNMSDTTSPDLDDPSWSPGREDQTESDKEKVAFIAQEAVAAFYNQEGEDQDSKLKQTTLGPPTAEEMKERRSIDPSLIDCKEPAGGKWKKIRCGMYEDPLGAIHSCDKCIQKQRTKSKHASFCTVSPATYLKTSYELKEDKHVAALKKPPPVSAEQEQHSLCFLSQQNTLSARPPLSPPAAGKESSEEQAEIEEKGGDKDVVVAWSATDLKKKEPSSMRLSTLIECYQRDDPDEESDIEDDGNNCLIA
jgi:hypothetical protein